jgi:hypothetical protein
MSDNDIKKESTVINWIEKGLIPGITKDFKKDEYIIPNQARPPYTVERRALIFPNDELISYVLEGYASSALRRDYSLTNYAFTALYDF